MGSLNISRALLIALACGVAAALTPLSAAGDDNDCALYLSGPGRTSAYDYSLNLLKGNFGYEGQHTCITYDAIDQAYLEARNRIVVSQPKGDWKAEDFASVGELILDISINLARRYGLTYEEIEKGLPLIDTSKTLIRDVCPPVFSHVECRAGKYRRLDGLCNNLQHPTWGSTMSPFQRLLGPLFSDGINAPRIAHTGRDLPLSRVVSRTMHPDEGFHDHAGTVMVIAWGQFMDHDYTLTGTPLDPINRNDPEECCKRPPHLKHPYCNEIRIPDDDYFYRLWNVKCIDFVRAFPSPRPGCRLGSRVPFNTLTGVIDGNTIYGVTDKFSRKLRTGFGGLLRMNPVFKEYGLKDLLPLKLDIPDEGCTRPNKNMYCFEAGEIRVNEQLVLTVMHTLMAREHNRVARALAHVNPHWGDETLFQEARRITVAQIQHITYNEFLPILLGKDVMEKFGLVLEKEGYWDGYDPAVNPDVIDAFASAAFRFGHSLLPTAVERWSKAHKFIASKRLSDLIRRPFDLYRAGVLDEYVMGLMNQVAQAMDDSITQEVTNHLFKKVGARFGMDLVSFNMQRGREFGIPGYMEFRKFCGLNGANSFQDLFGSMPNETVRKYESIFEHPIDVDLWSGGVSERPLPGSMLGPTFACVIATQFSYSRRGDRFWFELPNQPSSFTPEQLVEIRKARLARVICDNTDIIDTVQLYPMVLPDHELNPRVPCRSGILPSMDFSKWADSSPFHGDKPFVTDAYIPIQNETDKDAQQLNKTYANTNSTSKLTKTLLNDNKTNDVVSQNVETTTKVTPCETENCTENLQTCTECKNTTKESHGTDTVLKYVYKKDDKADNTKKPASHFKNSLKRKRRSTSGKASAPLIVNYETSHGPPIGPAFERQTSKNIEKPAANFNIETIHDNNPNKNSDEIVNRNIYKESDDNLSNIRRDEKSDESIEHEGNIRNNKTLLEDNSVEKSGFRDKNQSGEHSSESNEEDNERYRKDNSSEELSEEKEAPNNRYKEQNREPHNNNDDSRERSEFSSKEPHNDSDENYKDDRKGQYKEFEHNEEKGGHRREPHDSSESYENDKRNIPYKKHENSEERSEYTADKYRKTNSLHPESRGSNSHNDRSSQSEENNDSHEGKQPKSDYKRSTPLQDSNEGGEHSEESNKNSPIRDENRSDYSKPSEESSEHSKKGNVVENLSTKADLPSKNRTENQLYTNDKLSLIQSSEPESQEEETIIAIMKNKKRLNSPIKEVDLGDFNNYERIHINKAGAVEAIPDNYDDLSAPLITPLTTLQPVTVQESGKLLSKTDDTDSSSSVESNEENNRLVTIDDEEVKPVVEINSDKVQSLEENSKEALNSKSSEDTSLETFLGVKESDRIEDKEKIVVQPEGQTGGDVKQEFERIPLNYNHVKKEEEQNTDELPNSKPDPINILPPKEPERYDEHLNIKFDDISIKLPEIKLPEDILAYPYDESSYEKRDKKKKKKPKKENFFYYEEQEYNDDDSPRGPDHKNIQADVDEHSDYPSYYGNSHKKENYRQNKNNRDAHDDEEEEDLYEKFVRERFGKSGTFEKRSAKLTEPKSPSEDNAELFQALNSVLKKAENIEKEAQKSGDPNAGYIWTVEYAKPL